MLHPVKTCDCNGRLLRWQVACQPGTTMAINETPAATAKENAAAITHSHAITPKGVEIRDRCSRSSSKPAGSEEAWTI
jgi:hypothetical protein